MYYFRFYLKNALLCLHELTSHLNTTPQGVSHHNVGLLLKNWKRWLTLPVRDVTENAVVQAINFILHTLTKHAATHAAKDSKFKIFFYFMKKPINE